MKQDLLQESFGTLCRTINELVKLGYTLDFNLKDDCLVCKHTTTEFSPEEFQIDKVYRFEGDSDPKYQSILYAISSTKYGVKGTLVNGYGISSDESTTKLIEKLNTNHKLSIMENKSNNATRQRPEGERLLNAPLIEMNLNKYINQIKSESTWAQKRPKFYDTF